MFNKLLQRQIQKHLGGAGNIPPEQIPFLKAISESYDYYEQDRGMLERSIDLSSNEMIELDNNLREEAAELQKAQHQLEIASRDLSNLFNNIDDVMYSVDMVAY